MARPFSLHYGIPRESFVFSSFLPTLHSPCHPPCAPSSAANNGDLHTRVWLATADDGRVREAGPLSCCVSDKSQRLPGRPHAHRTFASVLILDAEAPARHARHYHSAFAVGGVMSHCFLLLLRTFRHLRGRSCCMHKYCSVRVSTAWWWL